MAEKYAFSNPNDMKALSALILARKPNTPVSVGYSTTLEGNRVDMGLLWLDPKPEDSRFTIRATRQTITRTFLSGLMIFVMPCVTP